MSDQTQHFVEHLAELRKRIIITLGTFFVALCGAFVFVDELLLWLTKDVEGKLQFLGPTDIIWLYLTLAGVFAIAVTIPVAGYQIWRFVSPGLRLHERRISLAYVPALALLFIAGLIFGYFVIYPMVLSFLTGLAQDQFELNYTAEKYIRFIINMTVPFGVLFEMPVVVMFLTSIGILNPMRWARMRRVAYFVLAVAAVSITPPDVVSDVLVIVPLFLLYEISVICSRWVHRRRLARLGSE